MTKGTEKAFVIIYSEYLRRRSFGTTKYNAVQFDDAKLVAIEAFSKWNPADIKLSLRELKNLGFIKSDILGNITLTEAGIEYMESKPKEYFTRFAGVVKDLLSLVIPLIST